MKTFRQQVLQNEKKPKEKKELRQEDTFDSGTGAYTDQEKDSENQES